ncbi:N-acetylmuramoyl-L-alanine amidase family protein [Clostridium tepidiprofundi]|nr:N-acetylmuramoyl-L-alanine amidase [Clostridium tepidiprofundi]
MVRKSYKKTKTRIRKKRKNKFFSYAVIFIWVILLGTSIGIYSYNHSNKHTKMVIAATDNKNQNNRKSDDNRLNKQNVDNKSSKNDKSDKKDNNVKEKGSIKEKSNITDKKDSSIKKKEAISVVIDSNKKVENKKVENKNTQQSTTEQKTKSTTIENKEASKSKGTENAKDTYDNVKKVKFNAENKVIVIDPGHADHPNLEKEPIAPGSKTMKIKDGGGTRGTFTKTPEYVVAMKVAKKLKTLLEQKGFTVIMTKTDNSVSLGNVERAEIGNKANAALVIRIHADGAANASAHGASMLVPALTKCTAPIYDESKRCGKIVIDTLTKEVGMYNRGVVYRKDITGFNWSKVPVILIEMGFMTNEQEDHLLNSPDYQDSIAKGLADGIQKALTP